MNRKLSQHTQQTCSAQCLFFDNLSFSLSDVRYYYVVILCRASYIELRMLWNCAKKCHGKIVVEPETTTTNYILKMCYWWWTETKLLPMVHHRQKNLEIMPLKKTILNIPALFMPRYNFPKIAFHCNSTSILLMLL